MFRLFNEIKKCIISIRKDLIYYWTKLLLCIEEFK